MAANAQRSTGTKVHIIPKDTIVCSCVCVYTVYTYILLYLDQIK